MNISSIKKDDSVTSLLAEAMRMNPESVAMLICKDGSYQLMISEFDDRLTVVGALEILKSEFLLRFYE
jgi:hypothetical protein